MQDGRNWRIYWQYKEDTDFVARWLADTAKRCGYPDSLRIPTSPAKSSVTPPEYQKPTKLEGKAREQAKEESESELPQPAIPTYKIGHEDFINLARFVSEYTKCRVRVPADFFTAIDRAIRLRKEHNSMYTSFDDISARHGHFIGILEYVREILTPLDNTGTPDEATGRSNTAQDNNLANRFSGLEVQEPTESSPPGHRLTSLPTSPPIITYEAAHHKDTQQPAFSLMLLFQDYAKIRGVIIQIWMAYRHGPCLLSAASLTTNTALDTLKSMEGDVKPIVDKLAVLRRSSETCFDFT